MPVSFTWEFNPATLLAIVLALLAGIKAWYDAKQRSEEACRIATEARAEAKAAREQIGILQAAFAAYRETQAERLVSREVLREVENRLAQSIDRLGDRLDAIIKNLWSGRGQSPPPPP